MTFIRNKQQMLTVLFCIIDFHSVKIRQASVSSFVGLLNNIYLCVIIFVSICATGNQRKLYRMIMIT